MKKSKFVLGLISTVALSLGLAMTSAAGVVGDIDGNDKLSPRDALLVLKSAAGIETGNYVVNVENADITEDGKVDAKDALRILGLATGNQYWSPVEPYIETFSGKVWVLGDSIAADHNAGSSNYERPLYGWGVVFHEYFNDLVKVENKAISSQSTKTYITFPSYDNAMDKMKENDYVFIAYGHNDHTPGVISINGEKVDRTTPLGDKNTEGTFQWYYKTKFIDPVLEKGGVPIILTPVCRATFDENGVFTEDQVHLDYGRAIVQLVEEYKAEGVEIYLIDTQMHTYNLYTELTKEEGGMEEVMSYHGLIGDASSEWNFDSTHFCEKGARMLAEFIIESLEDYNLEIVKHLRADWETVGDK